MAGGMVNLARDLVEVLLFHCDFEGAIPVIGALRS
jgi:hypothetical protein